MSDLSPFHTELLDFIQRETVKRAEEEGFSTEKDLELQSFQKHLKQALLTENSFSLSEIVESYQHIFETRGPLHIERKLLETFSKKEFADLGMESDFPKIYRALPRLYRRNHPSQSRIKKNFTHLPTLIRLAAEKAVFQLYEHQTIPEGAKIALFTWMIPDGWGDYRAAIEVIHKLKQRFPSLHIDWIALVPKKYALPHNEFYFIPYHEKSPLTLFKKETLNIFRSADVILQFPTYYPHTPELMQKIGHSRFCSIGEYGFLESSWFHPRSGNRSMGLHFLEKGILVPQLVEKRWIDLECKQLLQWIFQTPTPTPKDEKRYLDTHRFYLAYLSTVSGGTVYLHALFKSLEDEVCDIDLCAPDLRWFIGSLEQEKRSLSESSFGIRTIEIHFGTEVYSLNIGKKGKRVRIFSPNTLSHSDFQALLHLSNNFVAIRGNQSFSEAITANKVFFYDGRDHARYFLKDLLALAENRLGAHPKALTCLRGMAKAFLYNLPPEQGEWVEETFFQEKEPLLEIALEIGTALKSPDVVLGFQKLSALLKEEHSFEDFLYPFILREFCHIHHPEIAKLEQTHFNDFAAGTGSLSDLTKSLNLLLAKNL